MVNAEEVREDEAVGMEVDAEGGGDHAPVEGGGRPGGLIFDPDAVEGDGHSTPSASGSNLPSSGGTHPGSERSNESAPAGAPPPVARQPRLDRGPPLERRPLRGAGFAVPPAPAHEADEPEPPLTPYAPLPPGPETDLSIATTVSLLHASGSEPIEGRVRTAHLCEPARFFGVGRNDDVGGDFSKGYGAPEFMASLNRVTDHLTSGNAGACNDGLSKRTVKRMVLNFVEHLAEYMPTYRAARRDASGLSTKKIINEASSALAAGVAGRLREGNEGEGRLTKPEKVRMIVQALEANVRAQFNGRLATSLREHPLAADIFVMYEYATNASAPRAAPTNELELPAMNEMATPSNYRLGLKRGSNFDTDRALPSAPDTEIHSFWRRYWLTGGYGFSVPLPLGKAMDVSVTDSNGPPPSPSSPAPSECTEADESLAAELEADLELDIAAATLRSMRHTYAPHAYAVVCAALGQPLDDNSGVPLDPTMDPAEVSCDSNGNVRLMAKMVDVQNFIAETRAASEAACLVGAVLADYYARIRFEVDHELFEGNVSLTVAMHRVLRLRVESHFLSARLDPHRRGARRLARSSPSTSSDSSGVKPRKRKASKSKGSKIEKKSSASAKKLCYAWAERQFDRSAAGCDHTAAECKFRHSFASEAERAKQRSRARK